jgi:hypothetical protein
VAEPDTPSGLRAPLLMSSAYPRVDIGVAASSPEDVS